MLLPMFSRIDRNPCDHHVGKVDRCVLPMVDMQGLLSCLFGKSGWGNNGLEEAAFHSRQFLSLVNKQNTRYN